jgi:DNA-binding NtrC family response regulator
VNRQTRILVADDQPAVREALRILLVKEGYEVVSATSPREVLETLETSEVSLILLDLNYARDTTSGQEGLDLIAQIKKIEGAPPIVVMTAWATVDLAVAAMRAGARDFFQKPWENARVLAIARTQLDFSAAEQRGPYSQPKISVGNHRSDCSFTGNASRGRDHSTDRAF